MEITKQDLINNLYIPYLDVDLIQALSKHWIVIITTENDLIKINLKNKK